MFDPLTSQLIQTVPDLPGLDRERLPEDLTAAFASIVSFRVRLGQAAAAALPSELERQLEQFRRLATTLETMGCTRAKPRGSRRGSIRGCPRLSPP